MIYHSERDDISSGQAWAVSQWEQSDEAALFCSDYAVAGVGAWQYR